MVGPALVEEERALGVGGQVFHHHAFALDARADAHARPRVHVALEVGPHGVAGIGVEEDVVGRAVGTRVAAHHHRARELHVVVAARPDAAALGARGVVLDGAVLDEGAVVVVVDGAALVLALVARERAALDSGVVVVDVEAAALVARAVFGRAVRGEGAVLDGHVLLVDVDAAAVLSGVVPELDARDAALVGGSRMATYIDAAAVLVCDVLRDKRGAVAFDGEVGVVEVDAAAISRRQRFALGVDRVVRLDVGVILHRELGAGAARIDAAAHLGLVVADGTAGHRDSAVVAADPNAAAAAEHDQAVGGVVIGDDGVGHVERAVVAVHLHGAARLAARLVARERDMLEVEGRPLLHVDAAGGVRAIAAGHESAAGNRALIGVRVSAEGERVPGPGAVEGEGRVLLQLQHGTVA